MVTAESSTPDEQLVAATLAGDENAFGELTRKYKSRVFGVASRFSRNAAELEDICQEVFIQVYFKLRQFRRDSPFEHWIMRITTFKCYDYLRKRRRDKPGVSVDALLESGYEPSAPENPSAHPDLERLYAALAQLSPKERLVITLLELEERSVQEIAGLTGWSMGNVKVRAFRARAALRKLLEKKR
ncbi:MAG TPA: sigma-70 family RNA polymerase sigma factor [Candidatus Methylacidiphilales bacterium]|nr:sigma-70 family RNA polymerase sigma factor [Candidatus Methylacidiphilales bacterium]